ncbi:hypothetical protein AZG88_06700 [Rhodococcus sp. LB1]|nr:hypothetical protein AZG88_06700 [Rhodococcus sp. LB1]
MTTLSDAPYTSSTESDLERRKRLRTVVAASLLGTTVEWYDFFLYATAASLVFKQNCACRIVAGRGPEKAF